MPVKNALCGWRLKGIDGHAWGPQKREHHGGCYAGESEDKENLSDLHLHDLTGMAALLEGGCVNGSTGQATRRKAK